MAGRRQKALAKILPEWALDYTKRKSIVAYNPTREAEPKPVITPVYTMYRFNSKAIEESRLSVSDVCAVQKADEKITWINVDGLRKEEIEQLCACYGVHTLVIEDILSIGQRAKMDETDNVIFCLLPMLYYNEGTGEIESEQVSIVLGKDFVISFQEDPQRDVFDPIRDKLRNGHLKTRQRPADYLCYGLVDIIVDSYFNVIDKMNLRIEKLEDSLILQQEQNALAKISILRREIIVLKRAIAPVRDLVSGFLRSDNDLLEERHEKYYKDVLDHIIQANEYVENLREMLVNLQDLSMSQVNMRMNEVMKTFTMVATLLAPATVIGGIFGMNFDVIPLAHHAIGFYITVSVMLFVPLLMLIWFKKKGWF